MIFSIGAAYHSVSSVPVLKCSLRNRCSFESLHSNRLVVFALTLVEKAPAFVDHDRDRRGRFVRPSEMLRVDGKQRIRLATALRVRIWPRVTVMTLALMSAIGSNFAVGTSRVRCYSIALRIFLSGTCVKALITTK